MPTACDDPRPSRVRILVIDDDPDVGEVLGELLGGDYELHACYQADKAAAQVKDSDPDIVLLDLNLGHSEEDGFGVLETIRSRDPNLPVIILSLCQDTNTVVRAMKAGASHYVGRSPSHEELHERLRLVLDERRKTLWLEAHRLAGSAAIIGSSKAMEEVRDLALLGASSEIPVMILGETGTGKGLVASHIHRHGTRADGPYCDVNVAGLSTAVLDSELFGHEKGAFTDAAKLHRGLFELTEGGTILLDEIGDLAREAQVKLLKVVETGTFRRIGGERDLHTDTRILAATHARLDEMVSEGSFRPDLYHRLAGLIIHIPPLRERTEDIPELVSAFVGAEAELDDAALAFLLDHSWRGNVRELQQTLRGATLLARGRSIRQDQIKRVIESRGGAGDFPTRAVHLPYSEASRKFQREYLVNLLRRCEGNVSLASRESGITRAHLHTLIKQHNLSRKPGGG